MKSFMVPAEHHAAVQRVLHLGRSGEAAALPELIALSEFPSNEVQRLAASAIAKLAGFGADARAAVAALVPLALHGRHPQTRQYALRALKPYAAAAQAHLHDLRDLAADPAQRDYVRAAALTTVEAIGQAARDGEAGVTHRCQRCHAAVSTEEHRQAQQSFQRTYCGRCFDDKKQMLYQQEGKRLVSVYPADLPHLDQHLKSKLSLLGVVVGQRSESAATE